MGWGGGNLEGRGKVEKREALTPKKNRTNGIRKKGQEDTGLNTRRETAGGGA